MPDAVSPGEWIRARAEYVNSDPMYRELTREWVALWREWTADKRKLTPEHPEIIRKQALLGAFTTRMDERERSLEREFDDRSAPGPLR